MGCSDCKYHSKSLRRRALGVGDGDLELVEFDDEKQTVYVCKHEKQRDRDMGPEDANPGVGCTLFEGGTRGKVSPELARLLERAQQRPRTEGS